MQCPCLNKPPLAIRCQPRFAMSTNKRQVWCTSRLHPPPKSSPVSNAHPVRPGLSAGTTITGLGPSRVGTRTFETTVNSELQPHSLGYGFKHPAGYGQKHSLERTGTLYTGRLTVYILATHRPLVSKVRLSTRG